MGWWRAGGGLGSAVAPRASVMLADARDGDDNGSELALRRALNGGPGARSMASMAASINCTHTKPARAPSSAALLPSSRCVGVRVSIAGLAAQ